MSRVVAVLLCNISTVCQVPRRHLVLRVERGDPENAADVKAKRALALA
jgi:hypothetical protein